MKKIPKTDEDYVVFYAKKLRTDKNIFKHQKIFIESQMIASRTFFQNLFKFGSFKKQARQYLKKRGLIEKAN